MLQMNPTPSYYSDDQLAEYLKHISLPSAVNDELSVDNAEAIIQHHITTIPFENTEMHYTIRGQIDIDPQVVYDRIVKEKKGGTICHGQHMLLLGMLLKLGYRGYNVMARMNRTGGDPNVINLTGLEHQLILMQIPGDENTYFVDIGIGLGVTRPVPLTVGYEFDGLAPQKYRFAQGVHPDSPLTDKEAEEWRLLTNLDVKSNPLPDPGWMTYFQFSTQPYYLKDIVDFNWLSHNRPDAVLPKKIYVFIFTGKMAGEARGVKAIFENRVMSRTAGGVMEIVKVFGSEEERIAMLKETFGIECAADSKACIAGRPSAIIAEKE